MKKIPRRDLSKMEPLAIRREGYSVVQFSANEHLRFIDFIALGKHIGYYVRHYKDGIMTEKGVCSSTSIPHSDFSKWREAPLHDPAHEKM
jgi:hypothetical protein